MLIFPIHIVIRLNPLGFTFEILRIDIYSPRLSVPFFGALLSIDLSAEHGTHLDILFLSGLYHWQKYRKVIQGK